MWGQRIFRRSMCLCVSRSRGRSFNMNRIVLSTVAVLVAMVGFAMMGEEQEANAGLFGRKCCCKPSCAEDCGGGCGCARKHKCGGLFSRMKARKCRCAERSCCAPEPSCCAPAEQSCGCEPSCGCESSCGCDSGCGGDSGCGCEAAAPCGCEGGAAPAPADGGGMPVQASPPGMDAQAPAPPAPEAPANPAT